MIFFSLNDFFLMIFKSSLLLVILQYVVNMAPALWTSSRPNKHIFKFAREISPKYYNCASKAGAETEAPRRISTNKRKRKRKAASSDAFLLGRCISM